MMKRMARLRDLPDQAVDYLPEGLTHQADSMTIRRETTGSAPWLLAGRVVQNVQRKLFLEALTATQVVHPEHHPIYLEPGYYQVTRLREYMPEAIRTVMD